MITVQKSYGEYMNLSLLKKVRCRFLDRSTGVPVGGVVASLSVAFGDETKSIRFPVATLFSDATGYMSFDLKPIIDLGLPTASGLFISAPKFRLTNYDLLSSLVMETRAGAENKDVNARDSGAQSIDRELMMRVIAMLGEKKEGVSVFCFPDLSGEPFTRRA